MRLARIFIVVLLAGCSSHYSAADLAGRYVLALDRGTDTIELKADGKYVHSYVSKREAAPPQAGMWTLEELQAGPTVVLDDFHALSGQNVRDKGSYNLLLVERWLGTLYLITDIDLNEGYEKQ